MARLDRITAARLMSERHGIDFAGDFHLLHFSQQSALSEYARSVGYRKPANYPGSIARAFFYSIKRAQNG